MATPRALSVRMRSKSRDASFSVSAAVGSSRMSSRTFLDERARDHDELLGREIERPHLAYRRRCRAQTRERRERFGFRAPTSMKPQRVGSSFRQMFSATRQFRNDVDLLRHERDARALRCSASLGRKRWPLQVNAARNSFRRRARRRGSG